MKNYKRIRIDKKITRDEHRLVMEKYLCRKLNKDELVHHKNHNKEDNRIENLELTTRSEHAKNHYLKGDILKLESTKKGILNSANKRKLPYKEGYYTCHKCRKLKPVNDFWKNKDRWNKIQHICKECQSKTMKNYRIKIKLLKT